MRAGAEDDSLSDTTRFHPLLEELFEDMASGKLSPDEYPVRPLVIANGANSCNVARQTVRQSVGHHKFPPPARGALRGNGFGQAIPNEYPVRPCHHDFRQAIFYSCIALLYEYPMRLYHLD